MHVRTINTRIHVFTTVCYQYHAVPQALHVFRQLGDLQDVLQLPFESQFREGMKPMLRSKLPGLGLVQRIVEQDGRWVVETPNGMIVSKNG